MVGRLYYRAGLCLSYCRRSCRDETQGVKTLMVKAFAKAIGGTYHRVQFTPEYEHHGAYAVRHADGSWKVRRDSCFVTCYLLMKSTEPQQKHNLLY